MAGWTDAAAISQFVAALFTGGMAYATVRMARKTAQVATATEEEAQATRALVDHSQRELELSWSPLLVVKREKQGIGGTAARVEITNLGRGPAINGLYVSRVEGVAWRWTIFDGIEGEGGKRTLEMIEPPKPGTDLPWELLEPSPQDSDQTSRLTDAVFCEDVFGNRIRFAVGRTGREVSRRTDANRPGWAGKVRVGPWEWRLQPDAISGHASSVHEVGGESSLS
jgi:hypothetical protein